MTARACFFLILITATVRLFADDLELTGSTRVHFASVDEGKDALTASDDFVKRLSPFDRAARMKVERPVSEEEFLNFVGNNISSWSDDEERALREAIEAIRRSLDKFPVRLPKVVQLIKTTGAEEGDASYTRGLHRASQGGFSQEPGGSESGFLPRIVSCPVSLQSRPSREVVFNHRLYSV